MGADTEIAWCDDTLNVWLGCEKVSPGCKHCYAEVSTPVRVHRSRGLELWGPNGTRYETKSWQANLRSYVREAVKSGRRRRIFAQSESDTFEDRPDLVDVRARFFAEIDALDGRENESWHPSPVDMLLLTKRIENVPRMVPAHWLEPGCWPAYVWIGTTVENQEEANRRIPHLLRVPAAVRFLSCEPLLEAVDLRRLRVAAEGDLVQEADALAHGDQIHWVIVGGESGHHARPFDLRAAKSLLEQCRAAGVPFFMKQVGAKVIVRQFNPNAPAFDDETHIVTPKHPAGADPSEWPESLRVREMPRRGCAP